MIARLGRPLVHGAWHQDWWKADPAWTELLGEPATPTGLERVAAALSPRSDWHQALAPVSRLRPTPEPEALVVLAGQQPVLAGGAALVAHKAAQAIALAQELSDRWSRPVVPVFLLATQDHDTGEVDHVDCFKPSKGSLVRHRVQIHPDHEMFSRCEWDSGRLEVALRRVAPRFMRHKDKDGHLNNVLQDHVAQMLDATFGQQGLLLLEAHRLAEPGAEILDRALANPEQHAGQLRTGAARLRALGHSPAFDPEDPRPPVLESRDGRRKRLEPDDDGRTRLAERPDDFSPHASLRPIVQARCLPVVAQVCGPSEILYLGQARGLHQLHGETPPVLVPRLEATRLPDGFDPAAVDADLLDLRRAERPELARIAELERALDAFRHDLGKAHPWLRPRIERYADIALRGARRLSEAPLWKGRGIFGPSQRIHPRGRYQDTTLAWAPDAFAVGQPAAWGAFITDLCAPTAPPEHVAYTLPETLCHG